jgi:hypothetical protein
MRGAVVTPDERIDAYLDRILKASGSALKHHTMSSSLEKMRGEMLAICKAEWISGSNACHDAYHATHNAPQGGRGR